MNKLSLIFLFGVFLFTDNGVAQNVSRDENAVAANIKLLNSANSEVREAAAKELRRIVSKYPSRTSNIRDRDGGRAFWAKKVNSIVPGMLKAEVLQILPPFSEFPDTYSIGTGQSHTVTYRLDNVWNVSISFYNPDKVIKSPSLERRERTVNAKPPEKFTGVWTTWHINGQKAIEVQLKDGKNNGLLTVFHDNGNRSYVQHYVDNIAEGPDTGWYADGKLMYTAQYKNGKSDGQWLHFFADGSKSSETNYQNGVLHGLMAGWYENGRMRFEMNYKEGILHGNFAAWNEQGVLQYKREYRNGKILE